ncbi:MAG: hypothetical protein FJ315_00905 [SAR202 cluster bacterium]|nr:hypothetical protein [SAR202 cluster bacterium]
MTSADESGGAARLVAGANHVVALVGAGRSVESGIPPFRGPGGVWTRFGELPMNGFQRFLQDPAAYWGEQSQPAVEGPRAELANALQHARPNPGHHALVTLECMGIPRMTIAQNFDGLHLTAGAAKLVEIHGNRNKLRCLGCGLRLLRADWPLERLARHRDVLTCPECGGLVKGDGVMFGEPIPRPWADEAIRHVARCDCMLLVGTSGTVYPAAAFPRQVKADGGVLIEVKSLPTPFTPLCDVVLAESAAKALPERVERVVQLKRTWGRSVWESPSASSPCGAASSWTPHRSASGRSSQPLSVCAAGSAPATLCSGTSLAWAGRWSFRWTSMAL